jgi:hypothetical protein
MVLHRLTAPLLILLALLTTTSPAHAQPIDDLQRIGEWELVISGEVPEDARVWQSRSAAAFVVASDRLPFPVLIDARGGQVYELAADAIGEGDDLRLPADARKESVSKLMPGQGEAMFSIRGTVARLRYSSLEGEYGREDVFDHSPEYRTKADAYEPDEAELATLRSFGEPVRVRVIFGTWCGVCKTYMPNALRVDRELEGSNVRFEYFGLPAQDPWQHPEVGRTGIKEVPSAIVYVGDLEVGRFAGASGFADPEATLVEILEGAR